MFDRWSDLGDKRWHLLERSWAGVFRDHLLVELPVDDLCRHLDERMGRPSKDLHVVIGTLLLQQLHDLSDAATVEASNLVGEVKGKDILIVDDMTETAGTLHAAAQLLKESGASSVRAAVSHGVLHELAYERLRDGSIDELITTNSTVVDTRDLPITVLSIAPLLGEAILRIKNHESVTSLFRIKGS